MKFDLDASIEVLSRTPAVLRAMLEGLNDSWVMRNYGPETFSPFDVVGHLIHGERTDWVPRARVILEHGESRTFEPFDRYAMYKESRGTTLAHLLDEFAALREESIHSLKAMKLGPVELARRGTHPVFGSVTMEALLATWVVHDLNHIAQIAKAMAHQYRDAVGPWREYLSILPK